jgi:hypothetical protein
MVCQEVTFERGVIFCMDHLPVAGRVPDFQHG